MDKGFKARSGSLNVQETIDYYLKILPKPRFRKNKILQMKLEIGDKAREIRVKAVQRFDFGRKSEVSLGGTLRRDGLVNSLKKIELGNLKQKFGNDSERNTRNLMFSPRLDPIISYKTNKPKLSISSKFFSPAPCLPLFTAVNLKLNQSPIPIPCHITKPIQKPYAKTIQVDSSDITLESWQ